MRLVCVGPRGSGGLKTLQVQGLCWPDRLSSPLQSDLLSLPDGSAWAYDPVLRRAYHADLLFGPIGAYHAPGHTAATHVATQPGLPKRGRMTAV